MAEFGWHPGPEDWQELQSLENDARDRVVTVTPQVRALLLRVAAGLLFTKEAVEAAMNSPQETAELVIEMRRRIRAGSRALASALAQANRLKNEGEFARAKALLEEFAAGDQLPFYRELASAQISVFGLD